MKANKMNDYFHRGPIFYVCSSERNLVSSIKKGVYDTVYVIPFGE